MARNNGAILSALQTGRYGRTLGVGYVVLPTGPAAGVAVTPGVAAYGSWVEMLATAATALFLVGASVNQGSNTPDWAQFQIGVGAAASETVVTTWRVEPLVANQANGGALFPFPVPIAAGARIAVRAAAGAGVVVRFVLLAIEQTNVVAQ